MVERECGVTSEDSKVEVLDLAGSPGKGIRQLKQMHTSRCARESMPERCVAKATRGHVQLQIHLLAWRGDTHANTYTEIRGPEYERIAHAMETEYVVTAASLDSAVAVVP